MNSQASTPSCNNKIDRYCCTICGGDAFDKAFGYRLSSNKLLPQCLKCGSVERHRVVHNLVSTHALQLVRGKRCLQFAADPSLTGLPFRSVEVSQYGGTNSLDLMAIDRSDGSYEWIVANHVLEHICNPALALKEMFRVVGNGIVCLSLPDPITTPETVEWGRELGNGHFRQYGTDSLHLLTQGVPDSHGLQIVHQDPVTKAYDAIFFLSLSKLLIDDITKAAITTSLCIRCIGPRRGSSGI